MSNSNQSTSFCGSDNVDMNAVAIIGIGCRFPGATGPNQFWQLLLQEGDSITEVPPSRFDINALYDPTPAAPGKLITRWGGFLENIDLFDASFFGISPREAVRMDPQQRLLLEVSWEALENAGIVSSQFAGSRTGVYVGMQANDYEDLLLFGDDDNIDLYTAAGGFRNIAAGRISFALGLEGPSIVVDAACSSSLVAVHLACQSLRTGECDLSLACGSNLILIPEQSLGFSKAGMLSPDGHCKFGDESANGFVRSEGIGVVVLKPLIRAIADSDPIYAVIRGSAVNNDGNSGGLLMTPSRKGQESLLRQAYESAGIRPSAVQYVEAHGTGTSIGDPVELHALGSVLGEGRSAEDLCLVGSVKTNIGHTEAAAGIAGLIKTALCLKHGIIPASLHLNNPNPDIRWDQLPIVIPNRSSQWPPHSGPAIAGVSSFGISATNAHVVLQEFSQTVQNERPKDSNSKVYLLPLSAHSPEALKATALAYKEFLSASSADAPSISDICYTASVRRTHHDFRLAVLFDSVEQLSNQLDLFLKEEVSAGLLSGRKIPEQKRKICFVFPGQGSQWVGMGQQLLREEISFRKAIEECEQAMRPYVGWSLLDYLTGDPSQITLDQIDIIQPVIFAIQIGLVALWRAWGIEPDAVIGQSMGEVAAAYVAGILSIEDALKIICRRSQILKQKSGKGSMATVGLSFEEMQGFLNGYEERLSIAVSSSPVSVVISGDPGALLELTENLQAKDIFCRIINVDVASHSPQMESLKQELSRALDNLQPRSAAVPFYSTVSGRLDETQDLGTDYWWRNLRKPVLFSQTIQQLINDQYDIFLEISPHPIVQSSIQQVLHHTGKQATVLPSIRREEEERLVMLSSLAALYAEGYPVKWERLYSDGEVCLTLPSYPWQGEKFWIKDGSNDSSAESPTIHRRSRRGRANPLSGDHLQLAQSPDNHVFGIRLDRKSIPYVNDHKVQGDVILPGTAYMEMILSAAASLDSGSFFIKEMDYIKALFLTDESVAEIQIVFSRETDEEWSFKIFSRMDEGDQNPNAWALATTGKISFTPESSSRDALTGTSIEEFQATCDESISGADFYQRLADKGNQWGEAFQGIAHVWRKSHEALARIEAPEALERDLDLYKFHPALLDACAQILAVALPDESSNGSGNDPFVLKSVRLVRQYAQPARHLWSLARIRPVESGKRDLLNGDIQIFDESGQLVFELQDLTLQYLEYGAHSTETETTDDWFYQLDWEEKPLPTASSSVSDGDGRWLIFADSVGASQHLESLLKSRNISCVTVFAGDQFQRISDNCYRINPVSQADFTLLLADAFSPGQGPCRGIVHLWSLDAASSQEMTTELLEECLLNGSASVLPLIQAVSKFNSHQQSRVFLVTCNAQSTGNITGSVEFAQSPLWGLGRTIFQEHPELNCKLVDLSESSSTEEIESLVAELLFGDNEDQIALRGKTRLVARLARHLPGSGADPTRIERKRFEAGQDQNYRLEITNPGMLENLSLRRVARKKPGPGEVEIQVRVTGLNFRDVMTTFGLIQPANGIYCLGLECSGVITAVGDGVTGFEIGDPVMAVALNSFSAYVCTSADLTVHKPGHISFEDAATIPVVFLTAWYALVYLARLSKHERVLIHAAAGGTGMAAIQLARMIGAEIFATAGSPEKRELLRSMGIEHVMDSRSTDFADQIMRLTNGHGVDVVLNSLAGEFIPKSFLALASHGRFVEIGKRDIYQNKQLGLALFERNISFHVVDIFRMFAERPEFVGSMFKEAMQYMKNGSISPLPVTQFSVSDIGDAFHFMAQAKHTGKIAITHNQQDIVIDLPTDQSIRICPSDAYLITGGAGEIGLVMAQWLVEKGARNLILLNRTALPPREIWNDVNSSSPEAVQIGAIRELESQGATVHILTGDVADESLLNLMLRDFNGENGPAIRGVLHLAGVVKFESLQDSTLNDFAEIMRAKVKGAWLLHKLLKNQPLDFFILFSSGSSLLSSPLLGIYAAANSFLDGLASYRRSNGLPSLSINWGFWSEVGTIARVRKDGGRNLVTKGMRSFSPSQALKAMDRILNPQTTQVAIMPINWREWGRAYPMAAQSPLLSKLVNVDHQPNTKTINPVENDSLKRIFEAESEDRVALTEDYLASQLSRVLKQTASRLDRQTPLNKFGLDSLMAVELKNRIETHLGIIVPVVKLLRGPSIALLARQVLDQLGERTGNAPQVKAAAAAGGVWEEGRL